MDAARAREKLEVGGVTTDNKAVFYFLGSKNLNVRGMVKSTVDKKMIIQPILDNNHKQSKKQKL